MPKLIVIGPQKTGSTALYTYLNLHPNLKSNKNVLGSFEETQFFTDKNYYNGFDWYIVFKYYKLVNFNYIENY